MTDSDGPSTLRADARRNVDRIRAAAVEVFADRGFSAPLEDVAAAAKVSKATIFNRFGGRVGLVDAVIDDVAAKALLEVIGHARTISEAGRRVRAYVGALRDLQYRSPAVNGVLMRQVPGSEALMDLCREGEAFHVELVAQGRAAGVLADEVAAGDLHALTVDSALALEHGGRPPRADYDRRTGFILDGICRHG